MACMDNIDLAVCCPKKTVRHSLIDASALKLPESCMETPIYASLGTEVLMTGN